MIKILLALTICSCQVVPCESFKLELGALDGTARLCWQDGVLISATATGVPVQVSGYQAPDNANRTLQFSFGYENVWTATVHQYEGGVWQGVAVYAPEVLFFSESVPATNITLTPL